MVNKTIVKNEVIPTVTAVIGGAWGDEGKGKIASRESKDADLVIRATGGANAGHTVVYQGNEVKLHLVPGGIVYPQTICLIGQGVVIDLDVLFEDIKQLELIGVPNLKERIKISGNAHVVLPCHKELDAFYEKNRKNPIGTTKRGIGPAYADKANRIGIRVYDVLSTYCVLAKKIEEVIDFHNVYFRSVGITVSEEEKENIITKFYCHGVAIRNMVVNGDRLVEKYVSEGKKIVLEGAQAYRLDKAFGDYPNVTSSNCVTDGALIGGHLNHKDLKETIVVLKAYFSRVGNGPFPTEQNPDDSGITRKLGKEYGATTGRPRRTGWFDAVLVKSSKRALGPDYLCINHLDTIGMIGDKLGAIYMCVMYNYQNETIEYYPDDMEFTKKTPTPIYQKFEGGWYIPRYIRKYEDLPEKAKEYIQAIEKHTGIPVKYIGVGPGIDDLIVRNDV